MDKNKILKMTVILAAIVVIAGSLTRLMKRNSMSLTEYAQLQTASSAPSEENDKDQPPAESTPQPSADASGPSPEPTSTYNPDTDEPVSSGQPSGFPEEPDISPLIGASLNGTSQLELRSSLTDDFYYEPLSDSLRRYVTGISYPAPGEDGEEPEITFDELRYVHVLHYDFEGNSTEGELICNEYIAQDLVEIFYELYRNEYKVEKILLIDEYDGDDTASMEDNNTSCFNYRPVAESTSLSKHAYGLAIDVNPLYNPYITYTKAGEENVSPVSASPYADRSLSFPYKIDEDDLCYKLFIQHGFIWGGNWNNVKDYQHFQKTK